MTEFKNNKTKLLLFLVAPVLYLILFSLISHNMAVCVFYMPVICTYLDIFYSFNPEDMTYESGLLLTPLTPKRKWLINSLIISTGAHSWSSLCLIVWGCVSKKMPHEQVLPSLLVFLAPFALVLSVALYCVDYSKLKQWLQVPFGFSGIILFLILCFYPSILPYDINGLFIVSGISLAIIVFCLLLNRKATPEDLVINTNNMLRTYVSDVLGE